MRQFKVSLAGFRVDRKAIKKINHIIRSNRVTESKFVEEFEEEWAKAVGAKYCIATSSGSTALFAALLALRIIKPRIAVTHTTPLTYSATVNAIILSGLRPIFHDIDILTLRVAKYNGIKRNHVLVPVHLFGFEQPFPLRSLAVEDAAQAHGTIAKNGKHVGTNGIMGCFSFYAGHTLGAGELGAVTTQNRELAQILRAIKDNGRLERPRLAPFKFHYVGLNFKANEFVAAIAIEEIRKRKEIYQRRQAVYDELYEELSHLSSFLLLKRPKKVVPFAFPIICNKGISRDKVIYHLLKRGIECRNAYGCLPTQQPAYRTFAKYYKDGKLKNAEYVGTNGFIIGCHHTMTKPQIYHVIRVLHEIELNKSRYLVR